MQYLIAAVDDEEDILQALSVTFKKEGYTFKGFERAENFFNFVKKTTPDLIILDVMLEGITGYDICRTLRQDKRLAQIPVIFLSAKAEEFDKVLGLELGADDYIAKPFSPKELSARVRAVMRRLEAPSKKTKTDSSQESAIKIDKEAFEVFANSKKITVTLTEFKILEYLLEKKGKALRRDEILDYVWGDEKIITDRTIDVHVKNLREKLGTAGKLIKNIRGIGYKLEN
ncbi:MAG: response regulator transcription factor [Elusimicrobia bacterium]|nr:response regulator transcription factor [Elusimicrobiota bacterium]